MKNIDKSHREHYNYYVIVLPHGPARCRTYPHHERKTAMKHMIKRKAASAILAFCLVALLCAPLAVPASASGEYSRLLVLGDSISTGYGLPDYSTSDPYLCPSYGNKLAEAIGLKSRQTYINRAVNGDRSADLLALLQTIRNEVEASDLIVISIGGNDLLRSITEIASAITGIAVTSVDSAASALMGATPESFAAAAENTELQAKLVGIVTGYSANMAKITALLKEYNPSARVVFLAQYNPLKNVPNLETVNSFASPILASINVAMRAAAEAAGYEVADVPSVIDDFAAARTNILAYDIHPNSAGHEEIFKLLYAKLGITDTPVTTECVHEFGEWKEISEGPAWEPWTGERVCSKCGATETSEFPAKDTRPPETSQPEPEATSAPEADATTQAPDGEKGCKSAASLVFVAFAACLAALPLGKRR